MKGSLSDFASKRLTPERIGGRNPVERRKNLDELNANELDTLAKQERLIKVIAAGLSEIVANIPATDTRKPALDGTRELGSDTSLGRASHVGLISYVEFVLQIAQFESSEAGDQDYVAPKASRIYRQLEVSSLIKNIGVTSIGSSYVLRIDHSRSKKKKDGTWISSRTVYRVHRKISAAWEAAEAIGIADSRFLADVADEAAGSVQTDADQATRRAESAHKKEKKKQELLTALRGEIRQVHRPRGGHPEAAGSDNGLGSAPNGPTRKASTEASGREEDADACAVTPSPQGRCFPVQERCNLDQWEWLVRYTRSVSEQWLVLHLIESRRSATYTSSSGEDGEGTGWTAVSSEQLFEKFGVQYPTKDVWEDSALIEVKDAGEYISPQVANTTDSQPRAREFRVKQSALERWMELSEEGESRYKAHRRKLVRTHQPAQMTTDFLDENDNEIPSLVRKALEVLAEADHRGDFKAMEDAEKALARREGAEARHQLTTLRLMKETIKRQIIERENEVVRIKNAYRIQEVSGRISFKRGGPQGLNAEIKARFYVSEDYRNYDIVSCHTKALEQVAAEISSEVGKKIDISPWKEYPGKRVVAKQRDLPVSLVKFAEHAVKYGAVLPASTDQVKGFYVSDDSHSDDPTHWPAIPREAHKHKTSGSIADVGRAIKALRDEFADLREVVIEIADVLLTDYYEEVQSGGWMKNACGVSFGKHTCEEGFERQSACMAWMLQGLEAAFCHALTIFSAESEAFSVVANEHDGLIVRQETSSEEAFQEALNRAASRARSQSGFHLAEFEEKPFADEEAVTEFYGEA